MPAATQFIIVRVVRTAREHPRVEMVGFDATGFVAPVTLRRGVFAATLVSCPDDPPDGRGRSSRARVAGPARPRLIGPGELLTGELVEQEGEGAVEDGV